MNIVGFIAFLLLSSCIESKQPQVDHKAKLSVSFFSRGGGIDYKKRGELDTYLAAFQKNEKINLSVEQLKWGREGEIDYCVDLKSLSKSKVKKLIKGVRLLLGSSDLVRITEVDMCRH